MNAELVERVRRRVAGSGAPLNRELVAATIRAETGGLAGDSETLGLVRAAESELTGAGPLDPLLREPATTDVLVNGAKQVWVDRGAGLELTSIQFDDDLAVRRLAQRLAATAGRRLDDARPWVDAVLPDGSRLHAVLPPIAADGTCLSIRCFRPSGFTLGQLVGNGTVAPEVAPVVRSVVGARMAFLISGGTGTGKTTLLGCLLGLVHPNERLVLVEDAPELHPAHAHVVRLAARPPNVEGAGEVSLRQLVRQALRMRPDRLVVGEVRGAEVVELLAALNTGHEGGAGTVHANSAAEVPARFEALGGLGGLDRAALHSQLAAAVDVVFHLQRQPDGHRVLAEIGLLTRTGDLATIVPVWRLASGPGQAWDGLRRGLGARGWNGALT